MTARVLGECSHLMVALWFRQTTQLGLPTVVMKVRSERSSSEDEIRNISSRLKIDVDEKR